MKSLHIIYLTFLIGFTFISSCNNSKTQNKVAKHVILIGIDGMSPDGVNVADTPTLDHMMKTGAHSPSARAVLPSSSGANWASILNGAGPEQHGVISNSWRTDNFILPATNIDETDKFPSIFTVIRKQLPESTLGAIYHWDPIVNFFEEAKVDYSISPSSEEETTDLSINFIKENKPDFTFIHIDHVDGAGHGKGHGTPEYYAAVAKADSLIGEIVNATKEAGMFEETIFIVSSDHGGLGTGHGGPTIEEVGIPWIISGKGIKSDYTTQVPINTYDTPATILYALGLDIPYEWIGRPVKSVFKGQKEPELMFNKNISLIKPQILPESVDGFSPAGGLFLEGSATITINNLNDKGEIRYTLDGSEPTPSSPIYESPIEVTKTTVVNAQVYTGTTPLSLPTKGYFRVISNTEDHGINYTTYTSNEDLVQLPAFSTLASKGSGQIFEFNLNNIELPSTENVAATFKSYLHIEKAGEYRFYLASDDGSKLYINNKTVVDNDGDHGVIEKDGSINLTEGKHLIKVEWFNAAGGSYLGTYYEGPGITKQIIPANLLYLKK